MTPSVLAAVLVTDMAGADELLRTHGEAAAALVRGAHLAALRAVVGRHDGRELRTTGLGLVVVFPSAVAAVRCAVAMQLATTGAPDGQPARIGVEAGEQPQDVGDAHGRTVAVAEHLCAAAEAGEIVVGDVIRQIAGERAGAPILPAGRLRLGGMDETIATASVRWRDDDEETRETGDEPAVSPRIRVVIADDQQLLRSGFRVILEAEADLTVVGEAGDGHAAIDVVRRTRPDVVLMDIRMPGLDGLAATEQILADPDNVTAVVMLTTFDANEFVFRALRLGASGFLLKDAPAERLLDAIRTAVAGDALIAPSITRRLVADFVRAGRTPGGATPRELESITERELEVLRLVARGLSNAEIATELVLGQNTIKTHIARLLAKLGLRDRVQAVVLAYECGFVLPADAE
jgi:DNA-binding NarL/FixJ family response regulator/class 3 adenylate cyclase